MTACATCITDTVPLANGVKMPWLGLGTWLAKQGGEVEQAVRWALEIGYRSIDTATIYGNERGVGAAIQACGIPRDEVFLTTKVWNSDQGYQSTLTALDASLHRLGLDYVDLYLVHWPVRGLFKETWQAMEALYQNGKARAIGVSNFMVHHLEELLPETKIAPMVNQYEFHPHLVQPELLAFCRKHQIQAEAWGPLFRGDVDKVPEISRLAAKYGKTPAQVVLRWDLQHGVATIPKSSRRDRLQANAEIFDFAMTTEDMATLDDLDRRHRIGPDPDHFSF